MADNLPFHAAAPRRGEPGREYVETPLRGPSIRLVADDDGLVYPSSPDEVRLADRFALGFLQDPAPARLADAPTAGVDDPHGLRALNVPALRTRLQEAGLDSAGVRAVLVERLTNHLNDSEPTGSEES